MGCGSHTPFNAWGIGHKIWLFCLHPVIRFCYIGSATEPFFEENVLKVVILVDLAVHGELGVQATSPVIPDLFCKETGYKINLAIFNVKDVCFFIEVFKSR